MKSTTLYLLLPLLLVGCVEPKPDGPPTAQDIVTRAIEVHGGDMFEHVEIEFDFRGARFRVWRDGGMFSFTRTYADTSGNIVEEMSNDGFARTANAQHYEMDEREYLKLTEDVNSVVYFALLPYKLMDASVVKKLLDPITIEGQPYHTVQVTFEQQDGGRERDGETHGNRQRVPMRMSSPEVRSRRGSPPPFRRAMILSRSTSPSTSIPSVTWIRPRLVSASRLTPAVAGISTSIVPREVSISPRGCCEKLVKIRPRLVRASTAPATSCT